MTGPRVVPNPPVNEKAWQAAVVKFARDCGWWIYHTQLSKWSEKGWPDLTMCRPPRLLLVELKSDRGQVTDHQEEVLALLRACPGVEVYVWRPADRDHVAQTLAPPGARLVL